MRCLILVAVVAVACAAPEASLRGAALRAKWASFKATHGKSYQPHEEQQKLSAFVKNTREIEAHNARFAAGLESFHLAHNELSDMAPHEVIAKRTGFRASNRRVNATMFQSLGGVRAQKSCDWRAKGAVTPVKNQGECGSCYAFSAIGALEAAVFRNTGRLEVLSEQNIVDCTTDDHTYYSGGCDGGTQDTGMKYAIDNNGVASDAGYPYEGEVGSCRFSSSEAINPSISDVGMVPRENEAALLEALALNGPMAMALDVSDPKFMMYSGGVYKAARGVCKTHTEELNHALVLVGYGTERGQDYWLVKNSWGPTWGEGGYIKMLRGQNTCGIAADCYYPIV
jgi:C1A family cysteine protease